MKIRVRYFDEHGRCLHEAKYLYRGDRPDVFSDAVAQVRGWLGNAILPQDDFGDTPVIRYEPDESWIRFILVEEVPGRARQRLVVVGPGAVSGPAPESPSAGPPAPGP